MDEAVRIGHRIAIMRDGRVVQIGTAEDIVMNPADDYVAEFVAGISRLKVVHAHVVMQNIDQYEATCPALTADSPVVSANESLSKIIDVAIGSALPIKVESGGKVVGVITREAILKTVVEGTEMS